MKVERAALAKVLSNVRKAVAEGDTVPVLTHLLVDGGEITATDLDIGIVASFPPFEGMSFIIPADRFCKLVASLPNEFLKISLDDNVLSIKAKGHSSKFAVSPPTPEFPRIRREFRNWFKPTDDLIPALGYCLKTMNPARGAAFGSVLWGEHGVVSSDTAVITWCPVEGEFPEPGVLLSGKFVKEAHRMGKPKGWVVHEDSVCFNYEDTQLVGHLVDAQFPEQWQSYFPSEKPEGLVELNHEVGKVLSRVGKFSEDDAFGTETALTRLSLDKDGLSLDYEDNTGTITEQVALKSSAEWQIKINSARLSGILSICDFAAHVEEGGRSVLYLVGKNGSPRVVMSVKPQGKEKEEEVDG